MNTCVHNLNWSHFGALLRVPEKCQTKSIYNPHVFTEQGLYMLMTVLKGPLAVKQAKSSIYVVDNYIGLKTLMHLKNSPTGVDIILFSDNVGNNKLHNIEFMDFCKEYPSVKVSMKKTGGIFHDRFIVLDYGTADESFFYVVLHQRMHVVFTVP